MVCENKIILFFTHLLPLLFTLIETSVSGFYFAGALDDVFLEIK